MVKKKLEEEVAKAIVRGGMPAAIEALEKAENCPKCGSEMLFVPPSVNGSWNAHWRCKCGYEGKVKA